MEMKNHLFCNFKICSDSFIWTWALFHFLQFVLYKIICGHFLIWNPRFQVCFLWNLSVNKLFLARLKQKLFPLLLNNILHCLSFLRNNPQKCLHIVNFCFPTVHNHGSISPTSLREAFTCIDPKSANRHWSLDCLFALLGSVHVKASRKHVGEINP